MFQSIMKTINMSALPDGGKKLRDEVELLTDSLRQLDIQISHSKDTPTGSVCLGSTTNLYLESK